MPHRGRRGFILPLATLLVIVLGISGAGFLQLEFLERRLTMNEGDNHSAFYLAHAGLERAREAFKLPDGLPGQDNLTWTAILTGADPDYPSDSPPDPLLCPPPFRGCVIPPFGATVTAFDLPFGDTFDDGSYDVRAFNDEPGTVDSNQQLIFRALGQVRGERKLLEVQVMAVFDQGVINCDPNEQSDEDCKRLQTDPPGSVEVESMEGREPRALEFPPTLDQAFYGISDCNQDTDGDGTQDWRENFPWLWACEAVTGAQGFDGNKVIMADNTYYYIEGDVDIKHTEATGVVVFTNGNIDVGTQVELTNSVMAGMNGVRMNGNLTIDSPLPYPAIISGGVVHGNPGVNVYGTIYSMGEDGIDLRGGTRVEGVLFAIDGNVELNNDVTVTDANNPTYYSFMPGFEYPDEGKSTAVVGQTWRELDLNEP